MVYKLLVAGSMFVLMYSNCGNSSSPSPQMPGCVFALDVAASNESPPAMPALSIDIDLSGVRDPKPSSRTRPLVKTFNGKQYGGFAHTHAYSTAKGRATYEFEAVGRRVESKEFELYVAAPMQSELRLEHADDATVTDAATGNQLNKPYKLNPGHSHLTVRLSVPATQSSPAKGSGGGT